MMSMFLKMVSANQEPRFDRNVSKLGHNRPKGSHFGPFSSSWREIYRLLCTGFTTFGKWTEWNKALRSH